MASVLFIVSKLVIGGSERKTIRILNRLGVDGFEAHLACLDESDLHPNRIEPMVRVVSLHRRGKYSVSALMRLRDYVDRYRIQSMVCMNLYPILYGLPAAARSKAGCRCYAAVNTTDLPTTKERLAMTVYAPLLRRCDGIIFGAHLQMRAWISRYSLDPSRCGVIHNGVDIGQFMPDEMRAWRAQMRERYNIAPNDVLIGTVGQMRPEKQHGDLLLAAQGLLRAGNEIRIMFVGDGPQRRRLERMAADLGVASRVIFCGTMGDVRPALAALDIFVLTSTSVETFSNAALEAMAAGRPVVLSDIGGAAEMIEGGEGGSLFPPGDVEALARELVTLTKSPEDRFRVGQEGRMRVARKFTFDGMMAQYEGLFSSGGFW